MRTSLALLCLLAGVAATTVAQFAQGPKTGSLPAGFTVNTDQFEDVVGPGGGEPPVVPLNPETPYLPAPPNVMKPTGPEGSNYIEDRGSRPLDNHPVLIKSFLGLLDVGQGFPPDPIMAVGPNHIMALVNSTFRILDKNGTPLKTIAASSWFSAIAPGSGPNDPQVLYDHFHARWIMQWMTSPTATEHFHMFCVSDDDNPIGVWYQWKTPAITVGDSATGNWGDYPQMGYDSQAIYMTSRQFTLAGSVYQYAKLRIIPTAQLYLNNAGPIVWKDFWDLRDPANPGVAPDGIMPSIVYGTPGDYYLVNDSPFRPGTYFTIRRITNPTGTPTITAVNVPVVAYSSAPNAGQLGGGTALESGASRIRSRVIYRDSSLWAVHAIASGAGYSAVRYIRINTVSGTTTEDVAMGLDGFWHFYPTIMVDQDKNVILAYSRSGQSEYIGAYLSGRRNTDPPNYLAASSPMKVGEANYVRVGSGRNRWGDYNGIGLDPVDGNAVWALTEYAASPTNTWSTWIGEAKMGPLPGVVINSSRSSINAGLVEAGFSGDTAIVGLTNNGVNTLVISSITKSQAAYQLVNLPSFPANVITYDTLKFKVVFRPTGQGTVNDTIRIASNDPVNPVVNVAITGKGIVIGRAQAGVMYATSAIVGTTPSQLLTINPATGVATTVGATGVSEIDGLAIHPTTRELYGVLANTVNSTLYRMSRQYGDALQSRTTGIPNLRAIAFSLTGDTLYGGTATGRLYRINLATGDTTYIGTATNKAYSGFSISPTSNQLWASVRPPLVGRDSIYIINRTTGLGTTVGRTGLGVITPSIAFNKQGSLFAIIGSGTQANSLYSLDTLTAAATLIGATGTAGIQAIAMRTDSSGVVGVAEYPGSEVPSTFTLQQNYPNPFNPTTQIRYGLPQQSRVLLTVYNLVGQEVARLVDANQAGGYHEVLWDGTNSKGALVASGVYFYRFEARPASGNTFVELRKLVFLK